MGLIKKVLFAPFVGYRWVQALEYAAKEEYKASLDRLSSLEPFFGKNDVEYHLLKGFVTFAAEDYLSSINEFQIAQTLIENTKRYSEDEKRYMLCYASIFGSKAQSHLEQGKQDRLFEKIKYDQIKLSSVRKALKENFPLRNHPDWEENSNKKDIQCAKRSWRQIDGESPLLGKG